ncbi:alcohol dehydrogenase class IV [Aquamicrobium lusatiense]|uniref:Alcohol dehydrogenase class IV n=1 Tax=Aquamicrobium lusatiense TaxID=89772 RepID=A0A7W9VW34_9HYPH|nr:iron-containing alcohol dehydrogenase [Aquamicrobium lusatiense]MBB6013668.1 alcohol dehydrogenase class IV [Aquamicrobium lusatiense]
MTNPVSKWNYPTTVFFGVGRINELPAALASTGISNPLFVTDPGLAKLPVVASTLAILDAAKVPYGVFSDVKPNPVESNLTAGIEVFNKGGHDGVIAFGGGSALDLGKLIAFQAGQSRPVWDFEDIGDWWTRADADKIVPIVAVPTTAGTGSEVGRAGVITHEASHTKKVIFHPKMMPAIVIADPELTAGMPPFITAGTGMDALAHCLEAYCAPGYHPMADGIAVEGVRLVLENLPKAFHDGSDLIARANMMSAAAMGATAFQKGLGAIHSLSHPSGALYDTHHGMTNAVFMPYVLAFNREAIEERIERLAAYCGIEGGFDGFAAAIIRLREELKVPHTLPGLIKDLDMDATRKDLIAEMAIVDPTAGGNPLKLTKEGALRLLEGALTGTV